MANTLIESHVASIQLVKSADIAAGVNSATFDGKNFRRWSLQSRLTNMSVKIYASNWQKPGSNGWVDLTTSFVGAANLTDSTMVWQSTDLKVKWWKITWERSSANNLAHLELFRYDSDEGN